MHRIYKRFLFQKKGSSNDFRQKELPTTNFENSIFHPVQVKSNQKHTADGGLAKNQRVCNKFILETGLLDHCGGGTFFQAEHHEMMHDFWSSEALRKAQLIHHQKMNGNLQNTNLNKPLEISNIHRDTFSPSCHKSLKDKNESTSIEFFSKNSFVVAYQKRNFFRFVFIFGEALITKFHFWFYTLRQSFSSFPDHHAEGPGGGTIASLGTKFHMIFRSPLRRPQQSFFADMAQSSTSRSKQNWLFLRTKVPQLVTPRRLSGTPRWNQFVGSSLSFFRQLSTQILFQLLLIPYLFAFGIFYTFVGFKVDFSIPRVGVTDSLKNEILAVQEPILEAPSKATQDSPSGDFYSYQIDHTHSWGREKTFWVAFEILRFANYSSKIFVLWGFLNVWRGIRPAQSSRNEYTIQTRVLSPKKNKKRFTDVEGIEKFLPLLETLVQSFQYRSFLSNVFLGQSLPRKFFHFWNGEEKNRTLREGKTGRLQSQVRGRTKGWVKDTIYPKGYLFIGPPGTGKTLLAQAVAGEAGVSLICLSASEIQKQIDIGTRIGAIRLRNLFQQARQNTPCILFLDEIDSIGRTNTSEAQKNQIGTSQSDSPIFDRFQISELDSRFTEKTIGKKQKFSSQINEEQIQLRSAFNTNWIHGSSLFSFVGSDTDQEDIRTASSTVNQETGTLQQSNKKQENQSRTSDISLLTEFLIQMDSFFVQDGFLVIGTTNFLSHLDSAFIRSGRFDRIIGLQYPGKQTRIALLQLYAKKQGYDKSIDWPVFGQLTKGFSAADLAKVVNESSLFGIQNSFFESSLRRTSQDSLGPSVKGRTASGSASKQSLYERALRNQKKKNSSPKVVGEGAENSFMLQARPLDRQRRSYVLMNLLPDFLLKKWVKPPVHTSQSLKKGIEKISARQKFF